MWVTTKECSCKLLVAVHGTIPEGGRDGVSRCIEIPTCPLTGVSSILYYKHVFVFVRRHNNHKLHTWRMSLTQMYSFMSILLVTKCFGMVVLMMEEFFFFTSKKVDMICEEHTLATMKAFWKLFFEMTSIMSSGQYFTLTHKHRLVLSWPSSANSVPISWPSKTK